MVVFNRHGRACIVLIFYSNSLECVFALSQASLEYHVLLMIRARIVLGLGIFFSTVHLRYIALRLQHVIKSLTS